MIGFNPKKQRKLNKIEELQRELRALKICLHSLVLYGDPKNWAPTGEKRDIKNPAGIIVGESQVSKWIGPGSGPDLFHAAMAAAGITIRQKAPPKSVVSPSNHGAQDGERKSNCEALEP